MAETRPRFVGAARSWTRAQHAEARELPRAAGCGRSAQRILHRELWRFTRRSVPRGVAMGLFVGVFLLIPGVQIIGAALLSLPVRANIPIAAAMTFLTNPFTTPLPDRRLAASVGNLLGFDADVGRDQAMYARGASVERMAGLAALRCRAGHGRSGLFIIAVVGAAVGYLLVDLGLALVDGAQVAPPRAAGASHD